MNIAFTTYEVKCKWGRGEQSGERFPCWKKDNYEGLQCREPGWIQAVTDLNSLFQLPEVLWIERYEGSRMSRQRSESNARYQKANEWLHPDVFIPRHLRLE